MVIVLDRRKAACTFIACYWLCEGPEPSCEPVSIAGPTQPRFRCLGRDHHTTISRQASWVACEVGEWPSREKSCFTKQRNVFNVYKGIALKLHRSSSMHMRLMILTESFQNRDRLFSIAVDLFFCLTEFVEISTCIKRSEENIERHWRVPNLQEQDIDGFLYPQGKYLGTAGD